MGETADEMRSPNDNPGTGKSGNDGQNDEVAAIREDIEQTRAAMSETIDAIQEKLSPGHIKQQVKEATIGKAQQVAHAAGDKIHQVADAAKEKVERVTHRTMQPSTQPVAQPAAQPTLQSVGDKAKAAGSVIKEKATRAITWVKHHPLPCALAVLGVGVLIVRRRSADSTLSIEIPEDVSSQVTVVKR